MTPAKIVAECQRLEALANSKGYYNTRVCVYFNWISYDFSINVETRTDADARARDNFFHGVAADGFNAVFQKAEAHIDSLQSIQDAKRDAFIAAVGKLIDQGRDIGIEVDFLNPLTDMMTKLSSNILEKK